MKSRRAVVAAAVAVLTLAIFLPSLRGQFVNYDDDVNFLDNPNYRGLGPEQLKWMFTDLVSLWMPLTWMTLGLDYVIWGMNPVGYHLTNILFHAANAFLCFLLIDRLLGLLRPAHSDRVRWSAAAAGALFFSIHPLRVESVAWITERRDVVSGFFFLLTVLSYLLMADLPCGSPLRRRAYLRTLGLFLLSLLSKPTGMTLPLVLLLLDVYPLRRHTVEKPKALILEKIPFFALMIGAAFLTSLTLKNAKAFHTMETYPILQRLVQPGFRVSFYVLKELFPLSLSPLYVYRPELGLQHLLGWVAVAAVTGTLLLRRRELPAATTAWLAFGAMIAPVSGVFQAGLHFAADRYTYLPCLPFAVLVSAAMLSAPPRIPRPAVFGVASAVLIAFAFLTTKQEGIWKDSLSLWDRALDLDPRSYLAFNNRGAAKTERGDFAGAMADYEASIALRGDWEKSWNNRGIELARAGHHAGAVEAFTRSLNIEPDQTNAYGYRAISRLRINDLAGARADLDEALRRRPDAPYFLKRALLRGMDGNLDGAIADCTEALRLRPDYAEALMNRGMARVQKGDLAGGRQDLERALETAPAGSPLRVQIERLLRNPNPR